jgi:ABC-type glycerol-3-phosphate transport system substrate-binding protein
MRMKRKISLILCLSLIASFVLPGCTKRAESNDGLIHLRWVTYETAVPADLKEIIEAANAYSAKELGVVVDLELQPKEMINLIMASGEYYDIVFTSRWINMYDTNAAAGLYYDITDLVKEETPDLYKIVGEYWDAAEIDGRLYGVPTLKDMGAEMMFRFNADYFEGEKGMTIPEKMTFADVEPFLEAYKKDHPDKYPLAMDKTGVPGFTNFLETVVEKVVYIPYGDDCPKAIPMWECDELMEKHRLLHKWYKLGYINPDASAIDTTDADKSIPVRFGVAWRGYQGYSNPMDWGFNVKTSIYDGPYLSRATEQGAMLALCSACSEEKARAALKYIELLNTDRKFRDIFGYGIEGRHYNYLENGTVLRTMTGYERYNVHLYPYGSVVNASVESISSNILADPDQWEKVYEGYREYAIKSKTNGFVYDQTRKADIIAAVTAIYANYSTDLLTGTSDPDVVIPKMRAQMEAAGIGELIEDVQSCLDEHLKNNPDGGK